MSGTKAGGLKAAATNKAKYGDGFYGRIGRKGGQNGHTGGFAAMPHDKVVATGRKGGRIGKRGPARLTECNTCHQLTGTWVGRCRKCGAVKVGKEWYE